MRLNAEQKETFIHLLLSFFSPDKSCVDLVNLAYVFFRVWRKSQVTNYAKFSEIRFVLEFKSLLFASI